MKPIGVKYSVQDYDLNYPVENYPGNLIDFVVLNEQVYGVIQTVSNTFVKVPLDRIKAF